jgi:hypothetical protein
MDFSKTKKSPARLWMLVVGALLLGGGGAALLSSCDAMRALMGESLPDYEQPGGGPSGKNEDSDSLTPAPPPGLTTIQQVIDELDAGNEPVKLVIGAEHTFTWEQLLQAIQGKAKTVELDLSETKLAMDNNNEFNPRKSTDDAYTFGVPFITKLVLPNTAAKIAATTSAAEANAAFAGFTGLTEVSAAGSVGLEIGDRAFYERKSLITANFPTATVLGRSAFSGCDALTTADFRSLKEIRRTAFSSCTKLVKLHFPAEPPELIYNKDAQVPALFDGTRGDAAVIIYVPNQKAVDIYKAEWVESPKGNDNPIYSTGDEGNRNHKAVSFAVEKN